MLDLAIRFAVVALLTALCGIVAGPGYHYWGFLVLSGTFLGLSIGCMTVDIRQSRKDGP